MDNAITVELVPSGKGALIVINGCTFKQLPAEKAEKLALEIVRAYRFANLTVLGWDED